MSERPARTGGITGSGVVTGKEESEGSDPPSAWQVERTPEHRSGLERQERRAEGAGEARSPFDAQRPPYPRHPLDDRASLQCESAAHPEEAREVGTPRQPEVSDDEEEPLPLPTRQGQPLLGHDHLSVTAAGGSGAERTPPVAGRAHLAEPPVEHGGGGHDARNAFDDACEEAVVGEKPELREEARGRQQGQG